MCELPEIPVLEIPEEKDLTTR